MNDLQVEGVSVDLELITELFLPLEVVFYQLKLQVFDGLEFFSQETWSGKVILRVWRNKDAIQPILESFVCWVFLK